MLHLRDLLADALVWEKLRRLLRSGRLQIEEPGTAFTSIAAVSLVPEAVDVESSDLTVFFFRSFDPFCFDFFSGSFNDHHTVSICLGRSL